MPIILALISIANISFCGLPFLRGFYSKDLILEIVIMGGPRVGLFVIMILATFLTVIYSCRLSFLVRLNKPKSEVIYLISEGDNLMLIGAAILLPFTLIGGIYLS